MIQLYWKNADARVVGPEHGLTPEDIERVSPGVAKAHQSVVAQCQAGTLGYSRLPARTDYRDQVLAMVDKHRAGKIGRASCRERV